MIENILMINVVAWINIVGALLVYHYYKSFIA